MPIFDLLAHDRIALSTITPTETLVEVSALSMRFPARPVDCGFARRLAHASSGRDARSAARSLAGESRSTLRITRSDPGDAALHGAAGAQPAAPWR
jgi:hypothetical protein